MSKDPFAPIFYSLIQNNIGLNFVTCALLAMIALLCTDIYYRSQMKFVKVMLLQVCVCPQGEHAWQWGVAGGVWWGGHVWRGGGVRGGGWHAWQIPRDTVNERGGGGHVAKICLCRSVTEAVSSVLPINTNWHALNLSY